MSSGVPRKKRIVKAAIDIIEDTACWPNVKSIRPQNTGETCITYYLYHCALTKWQYNPCCTSENGAGPLGTYKLWGALPSPYGPGDDSKNTYSLRDKDSIPGNQKKAFFTSLKDPALTIPNGATHWGKNTGWAVSHYWFGSPWPLGSTASLAGAAAGPAVRGKGVIYTGEGPQSSYIPCLHGTPGTSSIQIGKDVSPLLPPGSISWTGSIEYNTTHTQSFVFGVYGAIGQGDTLNFYSGGTEGFDTKFFSFGPSVNAQAGAHFWAGNPGPPNGPNYYRDFVCVPTGNLPIQIVLSQSATDQTPKAGLMIVWTGWNDTVFP